MNNLEILLSNKSLKLLTVNLLLVNYNNIQKMINKLKFLFNVKDLKH